MTSRQGWTRLGIAALAVAAIGMPSSPATGSAQPSRAPSVAPAVTADDRPNIVVVLSDDQTYESAAQMPYLQSGPWVRFTDFIVASPICCPSRAAFLSGRYPHHTGVTTNHNAVNLDETSTIATWASAAGYETHYSGKYMNQFPYGRGDTYIPPGWDDFHAFQRVPRYYDYTLLDNGVPTAYGDAPEDYSTDVLTQKTVEFLEDDHDQPVFAVLAPYSPHSPFTPSPRHEGHFAGHDVVHTPNFDEAHVSDKPGWVRKRHRVDHTRRDTDRRNTYEMGLDLDDALQSVIEATPDNTIFVFTSDNGYSHGEHRYISKKCAYDECIRVPFYVRTPGLGADRTERALASNIDLAATLADYMDAEIPSDIDGTRSFRRVIDGTRERHSGSVLTEMLCSPMDCPKGVAVPVWHAVRTQRWMYIALSTGERELYDREHDRWQLRNHAGDPELADVQQRLARRLRELRLSGA